MTLRKIHVLSALLIAVYACVHIANHLARRLQIKLRTLHRISAIFIVAFAGLHVANHLASLVGIPSHIAFMEVARKLYRQPIVEVPLLLFVAFQVGSGLWLVIRGWKQRRGGVAWLQAISGTILAFFLLVHVGAVLYGRTTLNLDTNFYFAAAGFHVPPNQFFFGPYYFLAVLALFTHLGCAAYWHFQTSRPITRVIAIALPMLVGGAVSLLIVLSLAGKLQPVEVPAKYKATYARQDPAFKEQVQHPLRVNGEKQYSPLPLTGKKGVAKWNTVISPKQNDTSWGR